VYAADIHQDLKNSILDCDSHEEVLKYLNQNPETRALIRTSTAINIVQGGVKGKLNYVLCPYCE
jgi:hypothetical protein